MIARFLPLLAAAVVSGGTGQIAFTVDDSSVWVANSDGTHAHRLVASDLHELTDPTWSPDGSRLAYADGLPGGPTAIYVIGVDGSGRHRLTKQRNVDERSPAWSPDGRTIAFVKGDPSRGIYLMDPDGRNRRLLTKLRLADEPAWSPDGTKLVFSFADSPLGLRIVDADGTHLRRLVTPPRPDQNHSYYYVSPAWSPDGKRIAFVAVDAANSRAGGEVDTLRVMNARGGRSHTLPVTGDDNLVPTWCSKTRIVAVASGGLVEIDATNGHKRTLLRRRGFLSDPACRT